MTTHYVPTSNGPTRDQRFALCGVRTRTGGPREWDRAAECGSSNLLHVTCRACLEKIDGPPARCQFQRDTEKVSRKVKAECHTPKRT